jgi:hypothetical protein
MQNVPAVDSTGSDLLGAARASERTRCATGLLAWPEEPYVDRQPKARQRLLRGRCADRWHRAARTGAGRPLADIPRTAIIQFGWSAVERCHVTSARVSGNTIREGLM